jgi:hypothetical protein
MSIDETISESMSESFFGLFSDTIGVSVTTGYNWGSVTAGVKSDEVTVTVDAVAPAGDNINK